MGGGGANHCRFLEKSWNWISTVIKKIGEKSNYEKGFTASCRFHRGSLMAFSFPYAIELQFLVFWNMTYKQTMLDVLN
jgi:hypothetical protein